MRKRIVKKPDESKADIIKAATYLFQTTKYDKITIQNIMDRLGIAKGTVYHYFKSKADLLEAVSENIVDSTTHLTKSLIEQTKGSSLKKMQILIEAGNVSNEHSTILETLHRPENTVIHLRILALALKKQAPLYADLIQQGCNEGIFKTNHPLECAEFIIAATQFLTDRGIYSWTNHDLKRRKNALPALIEQQLNAPHGSFQFLNQLIK